jgi:hypothetical protein
MLLLFNLLLQSSVDRASGHPVVNKQRKEEKKKEARPIKHWKKSATQIIILPSPFSKRG